jgi:hypothetical protein
VQDAEGAGEERSPRHCGKSGKCEEKMKGGTRGSMKQEVVLFVKEAACRE